MSAVPETVSDVLAFCEHLYRGTYPHHENWRQFPLSKADSKVFLEQLALNPALDGYIIHEARWDYDARRGVVAFRMRPTENAHLFREIEHKVDDWHSEKWGIGHSNPVLLPYLKDIYAGLGNITLYDHPLPPGQPEEDTADGDGAIRPKRCPDSAWSYNNYFALPTVILEIGDRR